ncbi:MAG: hypothetical protein M1817_000047 [Caeruleum heppii]|nr:MAG: hypothetical protein M1817_000047 [Caeruleum heppii]
MSALHQLAWLVTRQAIGEEGVQAEAPEIVPECESSNEYDGRLGVRISAIFVILVGSSLGALFPIFANRHKGTRVPDWVFVFTKYFGSGVIIATAFIHLLAPASDALRNPCLTGPITEYPWVEGITLMTIFVMFFVELLAMRFSTFSHDDPVVVQPRDKPDKPENVVQPQDHGFAPGEDHLGHVREHSDREQYVAQMTAVFILEFGVIFHSIFIGLTLAVAGEEFNTLYVVLVFHQTFEGLGLGSRLAVAPWPRKRSWTPYALALAYGLTTPIAIAIGLGIKASIGSRSGLIVNGVFDSISAGILIYTGLVELMAHEFMFNVTMRRAKLSVVLAACGYMCLGAGLMSLLGKWA